MAQVNPDKVKLDKEMESRHLDNSPVPVLEKIKKEGRVWDDLCKQYGVDNPTPPWKITLEATCDVLSEVACALPSLERRWEEDDLSKERYDGIPFPERQLLALAHTMIRRGLINEEELDKKMKDLEQRLNCV